EAIERRGGKTAQRRLAQRVEGKVQDRKGPARCHAHGAKRRTLHFVNLIEHLIEHSIPSAFLHWLLPGERPAVACHPVMCPSTCKRCCRVLRQPWRGVAGGIQPLMG